ncbi:MAG: serine/threonine-protein kinase [Planctomycetota bacterium]
MNLPESSPKKSNEQEAFSDYQIIPKLSKEQIHNLKNFQVFEPPKTLEEREESRKSGKFWRPSLNAFAEKKEPPPLTPSPTKLVFKIHRLSKRWKYLRRAAIGYYFFLLWIFLCVYLPQSTLFLDSLQWYEHVGFSGKMLLGIFIFLALFRPKYIEIDLVKEMIYYPGYFFGKRFYFFYNIARVEFEVDMTYALVALEYAELCRIYLRLIDKKQLLLTEGLGQKPMCEIAQKLADSIHVVIQSCHRIGFKQKAKMSLGRYEIVEELSHGGMGKVFLAKDEFNNRCVALKILPASLALEPLQTQSFAREISILQKLFHPNVVQIYEVGRETYKGIDVYFFSMEYIEGENLSKLIPKNPHDTIDFKRIAQIIFQSAIALDYIHEKNIIHRDIKPSNIMLRQGDQGEQAVLIDFGIAKDTNTISLGGEKRMDQSHIKGSPAYMSPEQFLSSYTVDFRTDIYSLGVTMYELLTGKLPIGKGGMTTLGKKVPTWEPKDPRQLNPNIPEALETIIFRAIDKDRKKRYQKASDMAEDLQLWLHGQPIKATVSWKQKMKRRLKRFWRRFWRF